MTEKPGEDGCCIHEGDACEDPEHCKCFCEECKKAYEIANSDEDEVETE